MYPPNGSSAPNRAAAGSRVGSPCELIATPSGSSCPSRSRSAISVPMNAEVPISSTTGPLADGMPNAIGLVPSTGRAPPNGATLRDELAVWMPTRSASAIISQ